MFLNRVLLLHPEDHDDADAPRRSGAFGAASLSLHSFLDGVGIGLAFKVSTAVGAVVAAAVLAHDFSDGINTVTVVLKNRGRGLSALRWLAVDAIAPLAGVASTYFFTLSDATPRHPPRALLRLLPLHRSERPTARKPSPAPEGAHRPHEHRRGGRHLGRHPLRQLSSLQGSESMLRVTTRRRSAGANAPSPAVTR